MGRCFLLLLALGTTPAVAESDDRAVPVQDLAVKRGNSTLFELALAAPPASDAPSDEVDDPDKKLGIYCMLGICRTYWAVVVSLLVGFVAAYMDLGRIIRFMPRNTKEFDQLWTKRTICQWLGFAALWNFVFGLLEKDVEDPEPHEMYCIASICYTMWELVSAAITGFLLSYLDWGHEYLNLPSSIDGGEMTMPINAFAYTLCAMVLWKLLLGFLNRFEFLWVLDLPNKASDMLHTEYCLGGICRSIGMVLFGVLVGFTAACIDLGGYINVFGRKGDGNIFTKDVALQTVGFTALWSVLTAFLHVGF